jgi:hypothetical protein
MTKSSFSNFATLIMAVVPLTVFAMAAFQTAHIL